MEKGTIINGANTYAVTNHEGTVRRLEPIQEYTPLIFTNLKKGVAHLFCLSLSLAHDYHVNQASFDLPSDDNERLEDYNEDIKDKQLVRATVKTIHDGKITNNKFLILWNTQSNIPGLFIRKDDKLRIQVNEDVDALTLYARPIILNQAINLTKDAKFQGDSEPPDPETT